MHLFERCLQLIRQGAALVTSPEQAAEELGPLTGPGALALGLALAMSSTALVLRITQAHTPVGRAATAMLLFEDLALVPIIEGAGGTITGWNGAAVTMSNFKDVVAAGDVARWPNLRFSHVPRRVELWINAVEMARAAADRVSGHSSGQFV